MLQTYLLDRFRANATHILCVCCKRVFKVNSLVDGEVFAEEEALFGGVRESLNQDSPRNFSPFLLLPHNHTIKNIQELLNHVDNFPRWHESYRGY